MKNILICLLVILAVAVALPAQTTQPSNIYAAGLSYNNGASPSIAGTALYARLINDGSGTYLFTVADALPQNVHPFTVETSFGGGVAQKVFTIGSVPFYIPTSAGIAYTGTNTGWQWSTGVLASVKLKGNWRLMPNVRLQKASVGGAGYQPVVGFMFGYVQ